MKGLNYNYQKNNNSQLKKNYYFNTIKNQKNQNYNIIKEIETYPLELFINFLNKIDENDEIINQKEKENLNNDEIKEISDSNKNIIKLNETIAEKW